MGAERTKAAFTAVAFSAALAGCSSLSDALFTSPGMRDQKNDIAYYQCDNAAVMGGRDLPKEKVAENREKCSDQHLPRHQ